MISELGNNLPRSSAETRRGQSYRSSGGGSRRRAALREWAPVTNRPGHLSPGPRPRRAMLPPLTPEWPERAGRRSRGCYPHQSHAVSCVWLRGALVILYIATLVMLGKRVGLYVSLDVSKCERLLAKYPDLQGLRIKNVDPEESARCYQLLDQRRGEIGEELYAYCLRELLKSSTRGVSRDCRLRIEALTHTQQKM